MKRLLNAMICLIGFLPAEAMSGPGSKEPGPGPKVDSAAAHNSAVMNAGGVRFRFNNLIAGLEDKDSVLIIFDRYDHTGAGVVCKVFAADGDHGITVPGVAAGKYYVTVQCIGLHRDRLETVVTIRAQRSETVKVKLTALEAFSKSGVFIPAFHPDLSDLAVVRFK